MSIDVGKPLLFFNTLFHLYVLLSLSGFACGQDTLLRAREAGSADQKLVSGLQLVRRRMRPGDRCSAGAAARALPWRDQSSVIFENAHIDCREDLHSDDLVDLLL